MNLGNAETVALSKAVENGILKTARESLEPGTHKVSMNVRVEGTITVGQDYDTTLPNKAKPWNLVTVLLTEVNKLRTAAGMTGIDVNQLVQMAETVDPNMVTEAKEKAAKESAAIKAATISTVKGKVTTDLTVTPL
jgi:hypothetical protein